MEGREEARRHGLVEELPQRGGVVGEAEVGDEHGGEIGVREP